MSRVLAIDPGETQSAWVEMDGRKILAMGLDENAVVEEMLCDWRESLYGGPHLALEMIASYGMPVGRAVFETCVWIGRFIGAWPAWLQWSYVYRREVKLHLCNSARAKDSNVAQAIRDLYPRTGGGKTPAVGTKAQPGPLYGVKKDIWAALGVGLTWQAAPTPTRAP